MIDVIYDTGDFFTQSKNVDSGTISSFIMDDKNFDYIGGGIVQTAFSLKITNIIPGTIVRMFRLDNRLQLYGTQPTTTTFVYDYTYTTDINVFLVFNKNGYHILRLSNVLLTNKDNTIPIKQVLRIS